MSLCAHRAGANALKILRGPMSRKHPGVETRHRKACALNSAGSRCSCQPSYRAEAYDPDRRRRIFKTFPSAAAARSWRSAMQVKIKTGEAGAIDSPTLRDAYAAWATRAADGVIRNNRGELYKPSVLRSYNEVMHKHVLPRLGSRKLTDVRLVHVQDLIEELHRAGLAARTVHNVVAPLRVVFGDAIRREQARINPCIGVRLPSGETARDRIATPAEAVLLLEALESDRLLWALAFYAGLRAGEIMALDWSCVDLPARNLEIRRSYDPKAREFISPKTVKGTRRVPFPTLLVPYLMAERRPSGLVCGDGTEPWRPTTVRNRALRAWGWNPRKVERRAPAAARQGAARADQAARVPAHLRLAHAGLRRRHREGVEVDGALLDPDHRRPLRPPGPRRRDRRDAALRDLPDGRHRMTEKTYGPHPASELARRIASLSESLESGDGGVRGDFRKALDDSMRWSASTRTDAQSERTSRRTRPLRLATTRGARRSTRARPSAAMGDNPRSGNRPRPR
jgi:integrase